MKRASIGATSFAGSAIGCPVSRASTSAYASRSRCTAAGSSTVNFTGLSSAMAPSLSFAIFCPLPFVRLKHQIAIDDHPDRKARPDRQRRLDIEIAPNDLLTGLVQGIRCPASKRLNNVAIVAGIGPSPSRANAQQGREQRGFEQLEPSDCRPHPQDQHNPLRRRQADVPARSIGHSA